MLENIKRVISRIEIIKSKAAGFERNKSNPGSKNIIHSEIDSRSKGQTFSQNFSAQNDKEYKNNQFKPAENIEKINTEKNNDVMEFVKTHDLASQISIMDKLNSNSEKTGTVLKPLIQKNSHIKNIIERAIKINSEKYGVEPELIKSIIEIESSGNPRAVSNAGAQGLMQLMPVTAKELNVVSPFDINDNIRGGTEYFANMLNRFDSLEEALAAYNAGPGNVEKYKGIPPFNETRRYIEKVKNLYYKLKK
jgi:soluble lytic murein transglycosylase